MATKNSNAILRRIRSSVVTLSQQSPAAIPPDVHDLIQAVKDLDSHLSWGGTLPDDWGGAPSAASTTQVHETARAHPTVAHPAPGHDPHPVEDIMRRM
ncbi:MAG: hypothetical protein ACRDS0_27240 [Pseudonocardiaceae bacterium]